ncbi:MAG TPA: hypothetical protein VGO11_05820 [Chthoniobacteraceae bacterium]|jgi:hypothetical protein|nr:hypothetical protein [Chthoniobacteraceae bacterium]
MRTLLFALVLTLTASAEDLWVAVGDGGLRLTSTDGQSWQREQPWDNRQGPLCGIAHGLGRFLVVGGTETTGELLSSTDGRVWRELPVAQKKVDAIAFGRGRFVAAQGSRLLISTDGAAFTAGDRFDTKSPAHALRIACGDTEAGFRFVILGETEPIPGAPPDSWRAVTTDGTRIDELAPQPSATGLAYGAGHFVVVGRHRIESSHDGQVWSLQPAPGDLIRTVVWTGTRFFATTDDAVWVSTDALKWRRQKAFDPLPILWARDTPSPLGLGINPTGRLAVTLDFTAWKVVLPEGPRIRAVAQRTAE